MDRKSYLPFFESSANKNLISDFHEIFVNVRLAYLQAVNSKNSQKIKSLLSKIDDYLDYLEDLYESWSAVELRREYLKWYKYILDFVKEPNTLTISQINEAGLKTLKEILNACWPVHVEAVNALITNSNMYVKASLDWVHRVASDVLTKALQEKIRERLAKDTLAWASLQKMKESVTSILSDEKIMFFRDRAWRYRRIDRYVDMLVRTETSIANIQWTINRAIQLWITKFKIVENSDCCKLCAEYKWNIVDVKNWDIDMPPFHPNCRGYIIPQIDGN